MQQLKELFQRRPIADELKQKQAITDSLINKILYSKRLLVDHIEALEQCIQHTKEAAMVIQAKQSTAHMSKLITAQSTEIFTTRNVCMLLGSTILEHFITPKVLRLTLIPSVMITTGFGALYVVKNVFVCRNKMVERELDNLIKTIDDFGNCIRRNMTYFQEILIMKQQELIESMQIERAWDCITAAKEVTEILYDATRKLEEDYLIPAKYMEYYAPMEELRDCEYFKKNVTDYSPKHIKDFHNIFAYVQSQYLLRLALTILMKPSLSKLNTELSEIESQIHQLVQEEENHFKNLALDLNKKKQLELDELNSVKAMQQRSGPAAVLQNSSLKLSARMVAVAAECQALDTTLQRLTQAELDKRDNTQQLVAVANNMHGIENALSVCFDDFQRLMLVYNKFLNSKMGNEQLPNSTEKDDADETENSEFPESILRVEISQHPNETQQRDDFYAYMYDAKDAQRLEADQETPHQAPEMGILNFEKRITKGKFRPVLKQLKDRIDPIRQVMLEKEREVLASKGINVDQLFGADAEAPTKKQSNGIQKDNRLKEAQQKENSIEEHDSDSDGSSVGSAESEFERRSKKLKDCDNFAEMRNFLAQKQAINLFKLDTPQTLPQMAGEEELLESEC